MATPKEKFFMNLLENLDDYNDRHNAPFSNEKLLHVVSKVMAETEEEERDAKRNANIVTMNTFYQFPATTNTHRKIANVTNERKFSSDILSETIRGFKGLTLQSTVNDSAYYNLEENDAEIDPKID